MNSRHTAAPRAPSRRRGRGTAVLALAFALAGTLVPVLASAQSPIQSGAEMTLPVIAKDRGLHSGDFTLHPSVATQVNYDSNLFNGNDLEAGNRPKAATSLRIIPKLSLANDQVSNVAFSFTSAGDARLYLGSDSDAISKQSAVGGSAGLNVTFGARKPLSLSVFDNFNRSLRANNWETVTSLNRNTNDVGARVEFHPGDIPERRPFNVALSGTYSMDRFDEFSGGNTDTVRSRLTGSWKFLPKTAALLDVGWDFRYYSNSFLESRALSYNSKPFRARVGLAGAVTKRISLEVSGGWGMSNHTAGDAFSSYLATFSVGFRPSESTRLLLGYTHDFRDAYYGNYVDYHRGSLALRQRFGSILDVSAVFGVNYGVYGSVGADAVAKSLLVVNISQKNRKDTSLDGALTATFDVARWFAMDIGYRLRAIMTDYKITSKDGSILDVGSFTAHEVFASAILRY